MVNENDRLLPIANVGRIMKRILPPSAKISKEAKETMQECASEFISFVTGEASDKCHKENRRTVNGDDICWALSSLGLDNYVEAIQRYLHKYRESERERAQQNKGSSSSTEGRDDEGSNRNNKGHQADDDEKQTEATTPTPTPTLEFRLLETGKSSLSQSHREI